MCFRNKTVVNIKLMDDSNGQRALVVALHTDWFRHATISVFYLGRRYYGL